MNKEKADKSILRFESSGPRKVEAWKTLIGVAITESFYSELHEFSRIERVHLTDEEFHAIAQLVDTRKGKL